MDVGGVFLISLRCVCFLATDGARLAMKQKQKQKNKRARVRIPSTASTAVPKV